jgi:hypothetical protein
MSFDVAQIETSVSLIYGISWSGILVSLLVVTLRDDVSFEIPAPGGGVTVTHGSDPFCPGSQGVKNRGVAGVAHVN